MYLTFQKLIMPKWGKDIDTSWTWPSIGTPQKPHKEVATVLAWMCTKLMLPISLLGVFPKCELEFSRQLLLSWPSICLKMFNSFRALEECFSYVLVKSATSTFPLSPPAPQRQPYRGASECARQEPLDLGIPLATLLPITEDWKHFLLFLFSLPFILSVFSWL